MKSTAGTICESDENGGVLVAAQTGAMRGRFRVDARRP
jgi:hypothetical protein